MSVEVQELACRQGHIGLLTLNAAQTLNALTEDMVNQAQETLDRWATDDHLHGGVARQWRTGLLCRR